MRHQCRRAMSLSLLLVTLVPSMAWAAGKICAPDQLCQWLYRASIAGSVLGGLGIVAMLLTLHKAARYSALFIGVVDLAMGERFFSNPTYDIFYNNNTVALAQMGIGTLCLAFAILQIVRYRNQEPSLR